MYNHFPRSYWKAVFVKKTVLLVAKQYANIFSGFSGSMPIMLLSMSIVICIFIYVPTRRGGGHCGRVVTLSPPTSKAGVRFPAQPQVGNLVVACRWSSVYSTEP